MIAFRGTVKNEFLGPMHLRLERGKNGEPGRMRKYLRWKNTGEGKGSNVKRGEAPGQIREHELLGLGGEEKEKVKTFLPAEKRDVRG